MRRIFDRLIYLLFFCLILLSVGFALYNDGIIPAQTGIAIEAAYVPAFFVFLAMTAFNALLNLAEKLSGRTKQLSDKNNQRQKSHPVQKEGVLPLWVTALMLLRWGFIIIGVAFSFTLQKSYPLMLGLACFLMSSWLIYKALQKVDPVLANSAFPKKKDRHFDFGFGRRNDDGDGGD